MEKKRTIWHAVICVGLLCLIWGGYFLVKMYHTDRILDIKEDDFSWVYQVDEVGTERENFVLRGFAFELNKNATEGAFEIVLQDIESGKKYFPKMKYTERVDVNEYFLCGYDYMDSGFEATIRAKKLNLQDTHYEVLLRDAGERKTYQTGTYISNGEIMYTNPLEYEPLDVIGTDLEEVVEQGVLRVYRPDYGMYVYQYDGELYWVAEPEYEFTNEDVYIQYQLYTTQVNRLPKYRLENKWYWDNIGFMFSSNECAGGNLGRYRVTKKEVPQEYSVNRIETGNYNNGWIWFQEFRPYYDFGK